MSGTAFRFLHTSDWNLETPVYGINEVPGHLRDALIDAPFKAAKQVCDAALSAGVDFVILAGEITHPTHGGPRALDFLFQQFERLQRKNVAVYWISGGSDRPEMWPGSLPLPASVQTFPTDRIRSVTARRGDMTLAKIQGCSHPKNGKVRASDFTHSPGRFTIAAAHAQCDPAELRRTRIDYWALGGRRNQETLFSSPRNAQYCGSPQGRSLTEPGPHGCTLVDVDEAGLVSRQMIPTDVVRWHAENFELPDHMDREGLMRMLRERIRALRDAHSEQLLMVSWKIFDGDQLTDTRSDQLAASLRQSRLGDDLVQQLRTEFGSTAPGVWTVSLEAEAPVVFPSGWYEEDTVLGDLLRAVKEFRASKGHHIELDGWDEDIELPAEISDTLKTIRTDQRDELLRHVAALGVDLLRGDRVLSEELSTTEDG